MKKMIRQSFVIAMIISITLVKSNGQSVDPIQGAIAAKNLNLLKEAIANGGKVNQTFGFIFTRYAGATLTLEKATPLLYAMQTDWYEGVLELLRAGAKPHVGAKVDKLRNFKLSDCLVSEMDELTPMFVAVTLNNIDYIKLLVIAGADTRGTNAVKFTNNCRAYGNTKAGLIHLREYASEQGKEVLKEGKKAAWAANGLPAEGQRPL